MRLLLDTHVFIWWDSDPGQISKKALSLLQDSANTLLLSLVSIWEIQVKYSLGKLVLSQPLRDLVAYHRDHNGIQILPIELPHIYTLDTLPQHHRDPFDRLLIAQAVSESVSIVTADPEFSKYSVNVVI